MYKLYLLIILSLIYSCTFRTKDIDPSGTYSLIIHHDNKSDQSKDRIGLIQVKKIDLEKIAITFDLNSGFPEHNNTSFVDTISYTKNSAIYSPLNNKNIVLHFSFSENELLILETSDLQVSSRPVVNLNGTYQKISNETPLLIDPLTGEPLE